MAQRYIPNNESVLLKEEDPQKQIVLCLQTILNDYPPQDSYSYHDAHGFYSGPTSIAYLFLHLAHSHPDLVICNHHARFWCKAYMSGKRKRSAVEVTTDNCGVINEHLAGCAVLGALTGDEDYINALVYHTSTVVQESGSDEWLYGRAGFMYLLRMVRHWVPTSRDAMNACIQKVGDRILENGPPWKWHGKEYLGAVHGSVGIITQLILSGPHYAADHKVISTMKELLQSQEQGNGNFPSSVDSGRLSLVQFCHGAPGFVLSLPLIQKYFESTYQAAINTAVAEARDCIWKRGLLTKAPNVCHGAIGNALALSSPQRDHFMAYTTAEMIRKGKEEGWYIEGSDPYGLFCGEAGRAWGWAVMDSGKDLGIIGYSDV
ncbi:MAG: hypothetical protein Q9182_004435 [Xanthomendoza sp. 2 TL-2023]